MTTENILDLEDLARRYDAQVLREYLLEQDNSSSAPTSPQQGTTEDAIDTLNHLWPEVHDLRPRCFRRLRFLIALNFVGYWWAVVYCAYAYYFRVAEIGTAALPPLEVSLLAIFVLGTQTTLEFAASACLTQPVRATSANSFGFRGWDGVAWISGAGSRAAVLLDAQCLPLMQRGSSLLFLLSSFTFIFAIGLFVFLVQLRLVFGLFCSCDQFSYDKPDLFFKGRDARGMLEGAPMAARPPGSGATRNSAEDEEENTVLETSHIDRAPPVNTIKLANCAEFSDLSMLHAVITRIYVPISCQETQEFIVSVTSFSRCFCEDLVQCCVKFFFLMDCEMNVLVLVSLLVSSLQAITSCFYSSTSSMDLRNSDESTVRD